MNEIKKDKYAPQKRYAKKLNGRTVKLLLRLYKGKDDDLIEFLSKKEDKSAVIKKALRDYFKKN